MIYPKSLRALLLVAMLPVVLDLRFRLLRHNKHNDNLNIELYLTSTQRTQISHEHKSTRECVFC